MAITPTQTGLLSLFSGDTQVPASNGICAWVVGELRMVEQLSADWKAKGTDGSTVTWMTILKDIAHVVVGILSALALIVPTLGAIIPCLISESGQQTKQDVTTKARTAIQHLTDTHKKALEDQAAEHEKAIGSQQGTLDSTTKENTELKTRLNQTIEKHGFLSKAHDKLKEEFTLLKGSHDHEGLLSKLGHKLKGDDSSKTDKKDKAEKKDKSEKKDKKDKTDHGHTHDTKTEKKDKGEHHGKKDHNHGGGEQTQGAA